MSEVTCSIFLQLLWDSGVVSDLTVEGWLKDVKDDEESNYAELLDEPVVKKILEFFDESEDSYSFDSESGSESESDSESESESGSESGSDSESGSESKSGSESESESESGSGSESSSNEYDSEYESYSSESDSSLCSKKHSRS